MTSTIDPYTSEHAWREREEAPKSDEQRRALIVVDPQIDFCEGGSLPVEGATAVLTRIATFMDDWASRYWIAVATADWHVDPGDHFSEQPDYVDTWPAHCVAGTEGARFHPAVGLTILEPGYVNPIIGPSDPHFVPALPVFYKGQRRAAYSGFEGVTDPGGSSGQSLDSYLRARGITHVDVVGLAESHCVAATAIDAAEHGYATTVLGDLTVGVSPETTDDARRRMTEAGVKIIVQRELTAFNKL